MRAVGRTNIAAVPMSVLGWRRQIESSHEAGYVFNNRITIIATNKSIATWQMAVSVTVQSARLQATDMRHPQ
jgi:hypothetical protein